MTAALLPSLASQTTPATTAALAAPAETPRGRGRPTGGALPLPGPDAVAAMTPAELAAHLANIQQRNARVALKKAAALAALAALEKQEAGLKDAMKAAIHVAKTGDARLALEARARKAKEAAEKAAREAEELGALLAAPDAE